MKIKDTLKLIILAFNLTLMSVSFGSNACQPSTEELNKAIASFKALSKEIADSESLVKQYQKQTLCKNDANLKHAYTDAILLYRTSNITKLFNAALEAHYKSKDLASLEKLHASVYDDSKNKERTGVILDRALKSSEEMIKLGQLICAQAIATFEKTMHDQKAEAERLLEQQRLKKLADDQELFNILIQRLAKHLESIHADSIETDQAVDSLIQAKKTFGLIETLMHQNIPLQQSIMNKINYEKFRTSIALLNSINSHIRYAVLDDLKGWITQDHRALSDPKVDDEEITKVKESAINLSRSWEEMFRFFSFYGLFPTQITKNK